MARSGLKFTDAVEELFAELVSPNADTLAVSLTLPSADEPTATIRGIVAEDAPGLTGPGLVQVTICPAAPQVHPVDDAET